MFLTKHFVEITSALVTDLHNNILFAPIKNDYYS